MTMPIRVLVIIVLAFDILAGSPAASINIPPPIMSIKRANGGVMLKKMNSKILSTSTKKWQRVQGRLSFISVVLGSSWFCPQGTSPAADAWLAIANSPKNSPIIKIFAVLVIFLVLHF